MTGNAFDHPDADTGKMPIHTPSRRGIEGVLQWIQEAETVNRKWARNTLGLFVAFVLLAILALRLGWLPH